MHSKESKLQSPGVEDIAKEEFLKISPTVWQRYETQCMKQGDARREQENSDQAHSSMAHEDVDSDRDSSDHPNAPVISDRDTNNYN